jgi:regulator of replication initiation timing
LISELRDQIGFLKSQVKAERAQNTELIEQVSQWQKLMMNFQSENLKLRQEIEKYKKNISNNLVSTSMSEVSADELASGQLYSGEKLNGFHVNEQLESQQTNGAQAIIENLLRKTFPWGMPSRLPSNVKQELSSHLAEQGLGISDSRLNSIVSSIRKNW